MDDEEAGHAISLGRSGHTGPVATRRRTLLAITLLVGGGALGACAEDHPVEAGDVVAAGGQPIRTPAFDVRLPTGTLEVRLRAATPTVSASDTAEGEELPAVDGVRYLGVGWELRPTGTPPGSAGLFAGVGERPTLTLVGEGERIDLAVRDAAAGVFAAVPEDLPETGHLEVGFDGVVQQVSLDGYEVEPGAAAALYDDPPAGRQEQDCSGSAAEVGVTVDQTCGALVVEVPWAPEAGWAPTGTTWAAIRLEARLDTAEVGRGTGAASYTVTGAEVTATLGGEPPVATIERPATGAGDTNDWLVFAEPDAPADLAVTVEYAADRTSGSEGRPATTRFATTSTTRVTP